MSGCAPPPVHGERWAHLPPPRVPLASAFPPALPSLTLPACLFLQASGVGQHLLCRDPPEPPPASLQTLAGGGRSSSRAFKNISRPSHGPGLRGGRGGNGPAPAPQDHSQETLQEKLPGCRPGPGAERWPNSQPSCASGAKAAPCPPQDPEPGAACWSAGAGWGVGVGEAGRWAERAREGRALSWGGAGTLPSPCGDAQLHVSSSQ